jgi:chromosome segregation ATPase
MAKHDIGELITALNDAVNKLNNIRAERDALQAENARLREMLSKTTKILVAAFNRIHGLPRTTDTELSTEIEKCLGEIRRVREETQ